MSVKTYDPKQVSVIIGVAPLSGFADGDFVTVERNEDNWTLLVGADGESTRAKNANKSGKVTIRLMSESVSNDTLSDLQIADELGGNAPFGILIKDSLGRSLYTAATAWINKQPPAAFGKDTPADTVESHGRRRPRARRRPPLSLSLTRGKTKWLRVRSRGRSTGTCTRFSACPQRTRSA